MVEHVHFFSLGRHSFTTYFLTMKEVRPSKAYLICDQQIYEKGDLAYNTLRKLRDDKKILRLPSLKEMHKLLGNPLEATDSAHNIIQNRLSTLEALSPNTLRSEKEFASDWDKILFLERETKVADLKVIDKEAYAVREARVLIYKSQNLINRCHKRYEVIKNMSLSVEDEASFFISGNIPKELEYFISLIREEYDVVHALCPDLTNDDFNFSDGANLKKWKIYSEAKKLIDTYPHVILKEEPLVAKRRDYNTVCNTLFREISDNRDIKYSMNISAGVNQFCMSLFVVGSWLKADIYLTPTANEIIHLPLPNGFRNTIGEDNYSNGDNSSKAFRRGVLLALYDHYKEKTLSSEEEMLRYSDLSKLSGNQVHDGLATDVSFICDMAEIWSNNIFRMQTKSSKAKNTSKEKMTFNAIRSLKDRGLVREITFKYGAKKKGYLLTESGIFTCRMLSFGAGCGDC